jgi:hypothetical protein
MDGAVYSIASIPIERYNIQYVYPPRTPVTSPYSVRALTPTSMITVFGPDKDDEEFTEGEAPPKTAVARPRCKCLSSILSFMATRNNKPTSI